MNPRATVTVYISAASDLMAEREALARMIATLPVNLVWRILQTPLTDADVLELEWLHTADVYFLVMGSDIRAPVGLEWLRARRVGRPVHAYLKQGVLRTPAGQIFINDAGVEWQPFRDSTDLCLQIQRVMVQHLMRYAARYALSPEEITTLEALRTSETLAQQTAQGEEAGHSAVVLSRERFEPSQGLIVGESEGSEV